MTVLATINSQAIGGLYSGLVVEAVSTEVLPIVVLSRIDAEGTLRVTAPKDATVGIPAGASVRRVAAAVVRKYGK